MHSKKDVKDRLLNRVCRYCKYSRFGYTLPEEDKPTERKTVCAHKDVLNGTKGFIYCDINYSCNKWEKK